MKVKCARCSDNQDIYDRIQKLKTISDIRRNQNASFSYAKILKTLEKYPVPIISVKQALGLEGVGIKTASLINEVLNTKYETYKQARPVVAEDNSRSNSLTRLAFPEDQSRSPLPRTDFCLESLGVKRINTAVSFELNDDKSKKPAKPGKAAKITEKSTILLTTIYMRQTESQFRKYFTKDEIHAFLTKNPLVEPNTKLKLQPQTYQAMLDQGLICKLEFDTDVKYSLTADGFAIAQRNLEQNNNYSAVKEPKLPGKKKARSKSNNESKQDKWALPLLENANKIQESKEIKETRLSGPCEFDIGDLKSNDLSYQGVFNSQSNSLSIESDIMLGPCSNSQRFKGESSLTQRLRIIGIKSINNPSKPVKIPRAASSSKPLEFETKDIAQHRLVLIVDNREKGPKRDNSYFLEKLKMSGFEVETKMLSLGDFLWALEITTSSDAKYTLVLDYIIERKTVDDLAASIVDGRYKEQKQRLKRCQLDNVFYLVEGDLLQPGLFALKTALNSTRISEKFKIIRTENSRSSKLYISKLHQHVQQKLSRMLKETKISFKCHLDDFQKQQQKLATFTVKQATINALKQIKGVGPETAFNLVSIFPTILSLYRGVNDASMAETTETVLTKLLNNNQKQDLLTLFTCQCKYPID